MRKTTIKILLCLVYTIAAPALADDYDPPAGYYDLIGTEATLKEDLTVIMSIGHIQRTYGNFRDSAVYHDADPDNPGNILLVYNRASVDAEWDQGDTWNREHVWPQSLQPGSASNGSTGNLGDPHALRPADPFINGNRDNDPFGNYDSSGSHGAVSGGNYFPGDADKGDIARQLFYSDTRYDATLTDLSTGIVGDIDTLILWNYADPPDDFERRRNHVIYGAEGNPYPTNNRNAYIDHPEFVWEVYGGGDNDSQLYVGGAPNADGSSSTTLQQRVIVGGAPAPTPVTLHKTGNDPTYYGVTAGGDAVSSVNGRYNAFTFGADDATLDLYLDADTSTVGVYSSGSVTIDNIDTTTGGTGLGSDDGDDTIDIELSVLDHANASFEPVVDSHIIEINLGVIGALSSAKPVPFSIYNLEATPGLTAGLKLDSIMGTGDTSSLGLDLPLFDNLAAGAGMSFDALLSPGTLGSVFATYYLSTADEDLPGAAAGDVLEIDLSGFIALPGDFDVDGDVDLDDYNILSGNYGLGASATFEQGDTDGDGDVDFEDFVQFALHFGDTAGETLDSTVPEPAVLTGLMALLVLIRRRDTAS